MVPRDSADQGSEPNPTTTNTTNTVKGPQTVHLQTARVMAFGECSQRQLPVRVLFNNGSQLSYVTERLQQQLKLKPIKIEKLHLNTFGTASYKTQSCGVVNLSLQKPGFEEIVTISTLSSPVICSALPSAVNTGGYAHLNDLPLADRSINEKDSIDVLVGSNYYWTIVTGDLEEGPVAVSSKFGWLLSGPVPALGTNQLSHAHVIITAGFDSSVYDDKDIELLSTLRKFWETESIGVVEDSSPTASKDEEFFLSSIRFDGSRYEVGLPWMDHHPDIPDHLVMCQTRLKSLQK